MERWLEAFARVYFQRSADTAHDLKTPLNIAVLNLELLRIRVAKLTEGHDQKTAEYVAAIDGELRRMAQIFDSFFLLSIPPKEEHEPGVIDVAPICREVASSAQIDLQLAGPLPVRIHESRMRDALRLFLDGTVRALKSRGRRITAADSNGWVILSVSGEPGAADFELTKIFKFYNTDASGNPDLSLATARLIAETYGGQLNATREHDKVIFRLSLPQEINETSSDR